MYKTSAKIVIQKSYTKADLSFKNYRGYKEMQYMKCCRKRIKGIHGTVLKKNIYSEFTAFDNKCKLLEIILNSSEVSLRPMHSAKILSGRISINDNHSNTLKRITLAHMLRISRLHER